MLGVNSPGAGLENSWLLKTTKTSPVAIQSNNMVTIFILFPGKKTSSPSISLKNKGYSTTLPRTINRFCYLQNYPVLRNNDKYFVVWEGPVGNVRLFFITPLKPLVSQFSIHTLRDREWYRGRSYFRPLNMSLIMRRVLLLGKPWFEAPVSGAVRADSPSLGEECWII